MNKLRTYILPFIGTLLFACSQQNESSYMEEVDEMELVPIEETIVQMTYSWEESEVEQQNIIVSDLERDKNELGEPQHFTNNGLEDVLSKQQSSLEYTINETKEKSNASDTDEPSSRAITKEKALKAFVKSNTENLLDLLAIYNEAGQDEEISEVARLAIEDFLYTVDFEDLNAVVNLEGGEIKKLKLSTISINNEGAYVGAINIKGLAGHGSLQYQVLSVQTKLGISRKFQIVGLN